ncbi:hypothetical protein JTB14_013365 [Gonioctena quinquepunctata]|nr:hypothetical protein JTB14_013365 [Gonioctena quinquepunctata]
MHTEEQMQHVLELIKNENRSMRRVSELTGISFTILQIYYRKYKNSEGPVRLTPNYAVKKVLTTERGQSSLDYIMKCSQMFYGLIRQEVRQFAYEVAVTKGMALQLQKET